MKEKEEKIMYQTYMPQFQMGGIQPRPEYQPYIQQPTPAIRPVQSKDEAAVAQIPLDGSAVYFLNTATGEIYAKAFRTDGTAPLITYRRVEDTPAVQYATVEQLNAVIAELDKLRPKGKAKVADE